MTTIKEKTAFYSTIKFKASIFLVATLLFFYLLCISFTTSEALAKEIETERVLSSKKKNDIITFNTNPMDVSFLKDFKTRREDLKIKLTKDHSGLLFLTKAEMQDYLNFKPETKSWQKHAEYIIEGQEIKMNVFYPVNEISFLKYLPGLASRTCNFQLVLQLKVKDNSLYAIVKSIQLPKWASPLLISNVYWQVKTEEEWKYLKKISITEIGVFLIFEQKVESGR